MITMLSAVPYRSFIASSGNVYQADQYGIIPNVLTLADQSDLAGAGCATLAPVPTGLIGYKIGVNLNTTVDQQIVNLNNAFKYQITAIKMTNPSTGAPGTVQGGVYTGAGKTGSIIVASTQAYAGLTSTFTVLDLTLNAPALAYAAGTPLYLSLTTPQGSLETADIYIFGDTFPVT